MEFPTSMSIPVRKFQSFLGKLFQATKCTTGARVFTSRFLDTLATEHASCIYLSAPARADLRWFISFLGQFNGVTLIQPSNAQHVIHAIPAYREVVACAPAWRSTNSTTQTTSRTSASPSPASSVGTSSSLLASGSLPTPVLQSSSSVKTGPQ